MISDAWNIANDAYADANRRKAIINLLLTIAVIQVWVFDRYNEISLGIEKKLLQDVGVSMIYLVGVLSALTVAFQIPSELRNKTAMNLFAKPLGRESYLVGKFMGIGMLAFRNMIFVSIGVLSVLTLSSTQIQPYHFLKSILLSYVSVLDVIAIALILSVFLTEGIVVIASLLAVYIGNASYSLSVQEGGMHIVGTALKYILPNLNLLDVKIEATAGLTISESYMMLACGYGLTYAIMLLSVSVFIIKQKDL
ncbi:MAG: hypothetical protein HQL31_00955 [Planctomycetes bacterium]|nr:hypothetical protein [Planctomycetota bacterium]